MSRPAEHPTSIVGMHELETAVARLIRNVAATAIMPRFRQLAASDVVEKTPGEVVTIVDHEAEGLLDAGLRAILQGARVVGEEASAAEPTLLDGLDTGLVWIVDPLDGTANFAAGREPFGVIIALARDGVTLAAWLYNPVTARMCFAALGQGAFISDAGVPTRRLVTPAAGGRPIAALATQFMTDKLRNAIIESAARSFELHPIPRCSAEHYPMLALCKNHVALFQRTLPWDHAAGALFLTEAGGQVSRWDGAPYRFHDSGLGIVAGSSPAMWHKALTTLVGEGGLLADTRALQVQQFTP